MLTHCVQYEPLIGPVGVRIHAHHIIIVFYFHRNSNYGYDNSKYLDCLLLPCTMYVRCTTVFCLELTTGEESLRYEFLCSQRLQTNCRQSNIMAVQLGLNGTQAASTIATQLSSKPPHKEDNGGLIFPETSHRDTLQRGSTTHRCSQ